MSKEVGVYIKTIVFIFAVVFTVKTVEADSFLLEFSYGGMALLLTLSLFTALRDEK